MAVRWYRTGGKRFYVIDVVGYMIKPGHGRTTSKVRRQPSSTYAVLDRDDMHREVATFTPTGGPQQGSADCKRKAEALAKELNATEARERT